MNFHEIWHWVESHPYITAGIVFGAGAVIVIGYEALGAGGTSGPPMSVGDQIRLIQAQAAGQRSLITAQNQPALAQVQGQTAQARIGANAQTAQTRIGANVSNLATRLGSADTINQQKLSSADTIAGYANNLTSQRIEAALEQSMQQNALANADYQPGVAGYEATNDVFSPPQFSSVNFATMANSIFSPKFTPL